MEVESLTCWCQDNNLLLNVSKTKKMIVDTEKKQGRNYVRLHINGSSVERVDSLKYLGVHITEGLTWVLHTDSAVRKARQTLFHLRCLRKLLHYRERPDGEHRCLVWEQHRTGPQGPALPCLKDIYTGGYNTKAWKIIKDPNHPDNSLFSLLWSRRRYRIHQASVPQATWILNEDTA